MRLFHSGASKKKKIVVGLLAVLAIMFVVLPLFVEAPLRDFLERRMNSKLKGYTVHAEGLDLDLTDLGSKLKGVTITQNEHPDPPVARVDSFEVGVHWRELLSGAVVADCVIREPHLNIDLTNLQKEKADAEPVEEKGWQDALAATYPLTINTLKIQDAELAYVGKGDFEPLQLSRCSLEAYNIRNVLASGQNYPSRVHMEAVVFDSGHMAIDGAANFLAKPYPGFLIDGEVKDIDLSFFKPVADAINLAIQKGMLSKGHMHLEYSPWKKRILLNTLHLDGVRCDYLFPQRDDGRSETKRARKSPEAFAVAIQEIKISDSNVGVLNRGQDPQYRIFLSDAEATARGQIAGQGTTRVGMRGRFMGSGKTAFSGVFDTRSEGPDFSFELAMEQAELAALNKALKAHANIDVAQGRLSLYSEVAVKNGRITGYVKPLFSQVDVYQKDQEEHDSILAKIYEGTVGALSELLDTEPRDQLATRIDLSGNLEDPEISTLEAILLLVENAFTTAIVPGLEGAPTNE